MIDWQSLDPLQQASILQRPIMKDDEQLQGVVGKIIRAVQESGDDALKVLTGRFDGIELEDLEVSQSEIEAAISNLDSKVKEAIDNAHEMIERFHRAQVQPDIQVETLRGIECTLRIRPLQSVGLYVPGGETPLISTALMLGVPAQLAGCKQIALVSPPNRNSQIAPEIIYAASKCGIDTLFKVGGAQAIAALAFGTETLPKVDKLFGPGNRYVTEAKRQVSQIQGLVGIDMPAGPSELLIIGDQSANPRFVAADLLSQAEHGPDSQVILVSDSTELISRVKAELKIQMKELGRWKIAREALTHARYICVRDIEQAIEVSNSYAPEHLILNVENAEMYLESIIHAGSIFVGPWAPESAGDYASGTNHVLPTYGYARFTDSLSLKDFQKFSTVQKLTKAGLEGIAETIVTIAQKEYLDAHAKAVSMRLEGDLI